MEAESNRGKTRRTLMIYLDCIDLDLGREAGKVVDITEEGIMLLSPDPIPVGQGSNYSIELPKTEVFKDSIFHVRGICRWVRKEDLQNLYSMGIAFIQPDDECSRLVKLLIEKLGFSNGQKKIFTTSGDMGYK
jgi:hypothetical protein